MLDAIENEYRRHEPTEGVGISWADFPCWCTSADLRVCWRTSSFGLLRCASCGCYRIDPPPLVEAVAAKGFYTDYYQRPRAYPRVGPSPKASRSSRFWNVAAREPSVLRVAESAIDIGCGEGRLCYELWQHGWQTVIGLDVSTPRVMRARTRYPHLSFYNAEIGEIGVPPGSFDLMVMDNVIEHLPNPLAMVRELGRYLAPSGRLIIITPNMESGHFRLLGSRWTPELAPHAHVYLFTPRSLHQLVCVAGLRVQGTGSFHQPVASMAATLSRLGAGDLKGVVWRAVQDAGGLYGRLVGAGSMLYAVAAYGFHDAV